jgi:hypothetical protein
VELKIIKEVKNNMFRSKKYVILLLVVMILIITSFKVVPSMSLKKISIDELKGISLNSDEKVYVCRLTTYTGPEWIIVGDKNGLYGNGKPEEQVMIEGDFLPFLFRDKQDDVYAKTNFAIKVKVKSNKAFSKSDPTLYRVLKAEKWYILEN